MKTIFIPIFQGVEARNVLRTDVTKRLLSYPDVRVVFFVSSVERKNYYEREFLSDRVVFEVYSGYKPSTLEWILSKFKVYAFKSETMDNKRIMKRELGGGTFWYYRSLLWNRIWARPFCRKILRFIDYHFVRREHFTALFEKYRPQAVFLGHLFDDLETAMLREAKRRKIPTAGLINSWDKLTSRCILRLIPDALFVPNRLTYDEAQSYQDVPKANIIITGAPQFDIYFSTKFSPRADFCKVIGVEADKKLILVCPVGKAFSGSDWKILEHLQSLYAGNHIPQDIHFIVRFPPNDIVEKKSELDPKLFTFQTPGVRWSKTRGVDWDLNEADLKSLADTVYHSELLIPFWSTMNIDGAILNKPHINIDFDIEGGVYIDGSFYQYQSAHYKKILRTGSPTVVRNLDELKEGINTYLKDPTVQSEERKLMVTEQVYRLDGKAGSDMAEILYNMMS